MDSINHPMRLRDIPNEVEEADEILYCFKFFSTEYKTKSFSEDCCWSAAIERLLLSLSTVKSSH